MKITNAYLADCETLLSQGKTADVITQLMAVRDATAYKTEIISLSSRWRHLNRESMTGVQSETERTLNFSRINKDLLTLIVAMEREFAGEEVEENLLGSAPQKVTTHQAIWRTYVPIVLTALGVWAVCYFAYQPPAEECHQAYDLAGAWELSIRDSSGQNKLLGSATITQQSCQDNFRMSGEITSPTRPNELVDFSARIGGINDGEILFVYENFDAEMGVCRGVIPRGSEASFFVTCTDLIGRDRNAQPVFQMSFIKSEK